LLLKNLDSVFITAYICSVKVNKLKQPSKMAVRQIKCQLSDEAIRHIRADQALKLKIMTLWQISEKTLYRWLATNSVFLTNHSTIQLLVAETPLKEKDLLHHTATGLSMRKQNLHPTK
jgi:hypothetical protein